jgi:diguanylate cyclase (GGDEF)-like protein
MCVISDSSAAGTSRPRHACIVCVYGEELGRRHDIEGRELTIGSDTTCDIRVSQGSAAPTHAIITADDTGVKLRDNGSPNGTYVNAHKIQELHLENGDVINVGNAIFKVLIGHDIASAYHEELYRLSIVDGLTQVFNKRYFSDTLEREISRALRYDRPLAVCMLDLDGFARFNYAHGHIAGDRVLRRVSELVRDASRKVDVVARYGGDELAVILPEVELSNATAFAETIRASIEQTRFTFEDQPASITISVGVAELDPHLPTADDLVRVAAARLARAKDSGRNRVVASEGDDAPAP